MNTVYRNRCYRDISDDLDGEEQWEGVLLLDIETEERVFVKFDDPDLVLDPTDDVWFACDNAPARA